MSICLKKALIVLGFLLIVLSTNTRIADAQVYIIQLQGLTWDHLKLSVLIIPQTNQPWWRDYFLNATLRGLEEWNYALKNFSGYDTRYGFLSQIQFLPTISMNYMIGFDVYLTWVEQTNGSETVGTSQAEFRQPFFIVNNTIYLAARIQGGGYISEVDSQNVAVHELGHAFGLSHTQAFNDIMNPVLSLGGSILPISTLDAHGVWQIMYWVGESLPPSQAYPGRSSTLPIDISYEKLPIGYAFPDSNTPLNVLVKLVETYFGWVTILTGILIVMTALFNWRKQRFLYQPEPIPRLPDETNKLS